LFFLPNATCRCDNCLSSQDVAANNFKTQLSRAQLVQLDSNASSLEQEEVLGEVLIPEILLEIRSDSSSSSEEMEDQTPVIPRKYPLRSSRSNTPSTLASSKKTSRSDVLEKSVPESTKSAKKAKFAAAKPKGKGIKGERPSAKKRYTGSGRNRRK
jgi:hypothetical protein